MTDIWSLSVMNLLQFQKLNFVKLLFYITIITLNAWGNEAVSIGLKWKHSFQFAGYYAAIDQGYYKDEGFDVTLSEINLSRNLVQDVAYGVVDYGVSDSSLLVHYLQGLPVVLVSQIFQHSPLVFISHRDLGITTPQDLLGKKVMYSLNLGGDTPFKALILKSLGGFDGIEIENFTSYQDFIERKVDVTSAYSTSQPYWLKKMGIELNIIDPKSYGIDFYGDNFFTSQQELKLHPNRVKKMQRATLKGWEYALAHQEEIIDLILQKYSTKKSREALVFEARGTYQMIIPDLNDIGSCSTDRYNQVAKLYFQLGLVNQQIINEEFYYKLNSKKLLYTDKEKNWLKENPTIKIAFMDFWEHDASGNNMHTDIIKLLNEYGNISIVPVEFDTWKDGYMEAKSGQYIHGIINLNNSEQRKKEFYLTKPYQFLSSYLVVRKDNNSSVSSLEDLENKIVYVKERSRAKELLMNFYKNIQIQELKDEEEIYKKLSSSQEAAAALTYSVDKQKLQKYDLKIVKRSYSEYGEISIGVSHKYPELHSIINKIYKIIPSKKLISIQNKQYLKNKHRLNLTQEEIQWIEKNPVVKVGGGPDWAPFDFVDINGHYSGIANDYFKLISKMTGLEFRVEVDKWSENLKKMKSGEIDLLGAVYYTKERTSFMDYTEPYFEMLDYFFIREDLNIFTMQEMNGKVVAMPKGYAHEEILKKEFPKIKILTVNTFSEAIDAVLEKKADILFDTYASLSYVIKKEGLRGIVPFKSYRGHSAMKLHMTINKSKELLTSIINKSLNIIADEEKTEIYNSWLGKNIKKAQHLMILSKEEKEWLLKHKSIKVSNSDDWAPFDFSVDGKAEGYSVDILKNLAKKIGIELEFVHGKTWSELLKLFDSGKIDLMHTVSKTDERVKKWNYSKPYIKQTLSYFIRKDETDINSPQDFAGKTIAAGRGRVSTEIIKKRFPKATIVEYDLTKDIMWAVSLKEADIGIDNSASATYNIMGEFIANLKYGGAIDFKDSRLKEENYLYFAAQKNNPVIISILNKALEIMNTQERVYLHKKWFGMGAEEEILKSDIGLNKNEKQWIQENPVVSFSEINWKPMSIIEDNSMNGLMNEYLKIITQKTGLEFKFKSASSWSDVLEKFKNYEIDIIPGIGESDLESRLGVVSDIYTNFPLVLVTQNKESFIESIDELEGSDKIIAVPKYWTSYNYLKEQKPNIKVIGTDNVHEALDMVQSGQAYAFLGHMAIAMHYVGNYYTNTLRIAGRVEYNFNHRILVQNKKKILVDIINKVFANISEKEHLEIKNKWLKVKINKVEDYTLLYQVAAILSLFLFGVLYWNRKLSVEIQERHRIENALEIEKENFKVLFEKVSDGNLIIKDGQFVTCNNAALKMLGLKSVQQILSSTPNQWSPEKQPDGQNSADKAVLLIEQCFHEGSKRFEWVHRDAYGDEFWVDVGLTKIIYEGSDAIYVVWRDIREQKLLEHSLKQSEIQMKTLINSIPLHIIVTTYSGKILLANPQTLSDYGFDENRLSDINMLEFYVEVEQREEVIEEIKLKGRVDKKLVDFRRPDGIHSMLLSITPIVYDNENVLLSIGVDMSERLKMEEDLVAAKNIAELANKSKSEFLANMSHEIRTPMNAIIGFTELLSEQIQEPRLKTYVSTIQKSSNTLLTLINDILDLSKIEAGKLLINKGPTDIFTLTNEISSMFMMAVRSKKIDFLVEIDENIPHSLLLDEVRVRQVLINIVGNAVKFTEKGFVKLSIAAFNVDEHLSKLDIKFTVTDSGIGIPKDKIEAIFREFEQNDGQDSRKFGGTGLGLSISQRLCHMMGGTISVDSVNGDGSTFEISLYGIDIASIVELEHKQENEKIAVNRILFEYAKVLVVDDIEDNRELMVKNFEDTKIEIFTADDGLEGVLKFKEIQPDVIFMDLRMPNMDGYEASKEIKKISSVPIIALTASVMEGEFEVQKRKSFDGYLRKPVFRYELFEELSKHVAHTIEDSNDKEEREVVLSEKSKLNIVKILKRIDTEIVPLYEEVLKSNNISDMKVMAEKIHSLAEEYEIEILTKYADDFFEAIDVFDILKIDFLLKSFEEIQEKMN
jgi:PAS domain S-box-containing protein